MSDIRIYDYNGASNLVPLTGDVILCTEAFNGAQANSVHLCTNATGPVWKSFQNDAVSEAAPYVNQYALDVDGSDDYVDCGGASDFSFTDGAGNDSPFSISAWIKFHHLDRERIVSKDSGLSNREFLFGTDHTSKVNMHIGSSNVNLNVKNTTTLNYNDWFHIVATYDGSKSSSGLRVYVNSDDTNRQDASQGSYAGMPASGGNLEIGRFATGHSFFNGWIDEVSIFDYELTSTQVASLSSEDNTQPVDLSSLSITQPIAWYRMGDNIDRTGTTIENAVNPGTNDGTIVNATQLNTSPNFVDLSTTSETVYVA